MSFQIHIDGPEELKEHFPRIGLAAESTLSTAKRDAGALSIKLGDDEIMRQYHSEYLGEDKTTDVLSFPLGEIDPDTGLPYFGDILISAPQARKQAVEGGHSLESELTLLVVHGVLHLLGYDHLEKADETEMWRLQRKILSLLDSDIQGPAGT